MTISITVSRRMLAATVLIILLLVGVTRAFASHDPNIIHACVDPRGNIVVVNSAEDCTGINKRAISIATEDAIIQLQAQIDNLQKQANANANKLYHFSRVGNDIFITGANLHVVNGTGSTDGKPNFLGNIIIGYNEERGGGEDLRSGSHMLVVGEGLNYGGFGGIVAGYYNEATGNFASITGGGYSTASGDGSSVSGGSYNTASGIGSSVSGGNDNTASSDYSSISGGDFNEASGYISSVSGGQGNNASGDFASVSGGSANTATGESSSVSGGSSNTAQGFWSTVSGGYTNNAIGDYSSVNGGQANIASENFSNVDGSRVYMRINSVTLSPKTLGGGTIASCDPGDEITGGGYKYGPDNAKVMVSRDEPVQGSGDIGDHWFIITDNTSNYPVDLTVFALCVDLGR